MPRGGVIGWIIVALLTAQLVATVVLIAAVSDTHSIARLNRMDMNLGLIGLETEIRKLRENK